MFTVLIAEKEHIDAIREKNKLFFEPFLDNKDLAFCVWNPEGQNLRDSVPGLLDAVGRKKEWRVVILNNTTPDTLKTLNPFDVVDNIDPTYVQLIDAIEGKAELTIKPTEALRVMKVMEAALASWEEHKIIQVEI